MNKVIFLDVDGTLVNYENQIPNSAIEAIRKARANGHLVFICTGRSKAEVSADIWEIGLDGMIGGNGSFVEFRGETVFHQVIAEQTAKEVVDWLFANNLEFYLESNNGLFASPNFAKAALPVMEKYMARKGITAQNAAAKFLEQMIYSKTKEELYRTDLNKISFILNSYQDHLNSKIAFPNLVAKTWGGAGETALFGDLGVKDIDKAYAIDLLLKKINIDKKDTIAFGDAAVDIPMFEYCEIGVAMGNGGESIKKIADLITDSVDEDGIFKAFEKLELIT